VIGERIGTILHEMTQAFLGLYKCIECFTADENACAHGRAWQVVAKAIEEQSLRLLGVEVSLGRLDAVFADRKEQKGRWTIHGLEVCGFIDSEVGE
jgi:hypothetical protein